MEERRFSLWGLILAGLAWLLLIIVGLVIGGPLTGADVLIIASVISLPLTVRSFRLPLGWGQGTCCFLGGACLSDVLVSIPSSSGAALTKGLMAAVFLYFGFRKPKARPDRTQN